MLNKIWIYLFGGYVYKEFTVSDITISYLNDSDKYEYGDIVRISYYKEGKLSLWKRKMLN